MTWTSGTATDSFDLMDRLRTFLTATLPAGERWTEIGWEGGYNTTMAITASVNTTSAASAFDSSSSSYWGTPSTPTLPVYLTVQYDQPAYVSSLTLVVYSTASAPASFDVQWSDDGISWNTQDAIIGLLAGDWVSSIKTFSLTGNPASRHKYWRLRFNTLVPLANTITINSCKFYEGTYDLTFEKRKRINLRGQGGGTDQIFVNLETAYHPTADYYNWRIYGATGFLTGSPDTLSGHPGASLPASLLLWNAAIPYWFIANGRRFMVIAKINTTYHAMYAGFIIPYGTPQQFPYPLAIGGSCSDVTGTTRWSNATAITRNFYDPGNAAANPQPASSLKLRFPDGTWYGFANWYPSSGDSACGGARSVWPFATDTETYSVWSRVRENIGGSYALFQCILASYPSYPSANVLGELQGVFAVSGFNSGAENTVTVGGVAHLVIPNISRSAKNAWAAIRLE